MKNSINIATIGVPDDYKNSLTPLIIKSLGYTINWCNPNSADIIIYGPFPPKNRSLRRFIPKPLRPITQHFYPESSRQYAAISIFQTSENLRHNHITSDFSISFDIGLDNQKHCRMPYWMEQVDWAHEGIVGNSNPRFGQLLKLERLMQPLGNSFLKRPMKAAFFSSHLREPRGTLYQALNHVMPVTGFGPYFDTAIENHLSSSFQKYSVLQDYGYNLCPENSMYPGYYTEKIPEAFQAGCLPISWADPNLCLDFNPDALINLAPMTHNNFIELGNLFSSKARLSDFSEQALIIKKPSIEPQKYFIKNIIELTK